MSRRKIAWFGMRLHRWVGRSGSRSAIAYVRPTVFAAVYRRVGTALLLDRAPPSVLDRRTVLDDASDRDGPSIGRLPQGTSDQRARRERRVGKIGSRSCQSLYDVSADHRALELVGCLR
jgi:hypothetical protein